MDKIKHPLECAKDFVVIRWGSFQLKKVYNFELISFNKAPSRPYADEGAYLDVCAVSQDNYDNPIILKDEFFLMSIAHKTLVNALNEVSMITRKQIMMDNETNVLIKFSRISRKSMKILEIKVKENTPELKERAEKEYKELEENGGESVG